MTAIHKYVTPGIVLLALVFPASSFAVTKAGQVVSITGRATATTPDGDIRKVSKGSALYAQDTITTSYSSYTRMKLDDGSYIMLRPDSRFVIDEFSYKKDREDKGFFSLLRGGFRAVTGLISNKKQYKYRTSVATIGIRGTGFMVRVCNGDCLDIEPPPNDGVYVEVTDDTVILTNNAGSFIFHEGQFAYILDSNTAAQTLDSRPDVFEQSPIPPADPADCSQ